MEFQDCLTLNNIQFPHILSRRNKNNTVGPKMIFEEAYFKFKSPFPTKTLNYVTLQAVRISNYLHGYITLS